MKFDVDTLGSGDLDYAREDALPAPEAHAHVVRALRRSGYVSESIESFVLSCLERLAMVADLKDQLRDLGIPEVQLDRKSLSQLTLLLAETTGAGE